LVAPPRKFSPMSVVIESQKQLYDDVDAWCQQAGAGAADAGALDWDGKPRHSPATRRRPARQVGGGARSEELRRARGGACVVSHFAREIERRPAVVVGGVGVGAGGEQRLDDGVTTSA